MKINANVIKKENSSALLEITVGEDPIKEEYAWVINDFQKNTALPGFRKGKAPLEMIKQRFKDNIDKEVLSNLIPKAYSEALDITKISPIDMPEIKVDNFDEKNLKFKADVQLQPEITVKSYKGMTFHKDECKILSEDIDKELKKIQERFADFILREDKKIEDNDVVVLNVKALDENKNIIKDLTQEDQKVEVKKDNLNEEFYKNIIGLKTAEEKQFTKKYPADFNNGLIAGKEITFIVNVKEVREKKLPLLDNEFAKDVGDYKSIEDLRAAIEKQITEIMRSHLDRHLEKQIINSIIEHSKFQIPQKLIKNRSNTLLEEFKHNLSRQGHDFQKMIEKKIISLNSIQDEINEQALRDLKEYLLVMEIAKQEKFEITGAELDETLSKEAAHHQQSLEEYKKKMDEDTSHYIKQNLMVKKVIDFLKNNNKIKQGKTYSVEEIIKEMEKKR